MFYEKDSYSQLSLLPSVGRAAVEAVLFPRSELIVYAPQHKSASCNITM